MSGNPGWPDLESAIGWISYRIIVVWARGVGILGSLAGDGANGWICKGYGEMGKAGGVGMGCALGIRVRSKNSRVGQLAGRRTLDPLMEVRVLPREFPYP